MKNQEIQLSRTMILALLGFMALCLAGVVVTGALVWCLAVPELGAHVPHVMTTLAIVVGAIATVTTGGAMAHGARHLGAAEPSGGLPAGDP